MTKLVLLVILGIVAVYYLPDSRRWVVRETRPVWVPVIEWNTKQRMRQIAQDVIADDRRTGRLPDSADWLQWLDYHYTLEQWKTDAWGTVYRLRVWPDSIAIVSSGPDREPGTADDFMVTAVRPGAGAP